MHKWVKGLLAAVVNGLASGVILVVVDPQAFNLETGLPALLKASLLLGLLGMANYLKQAPVPPDPVEPVQP